MKKYLVIIFIMAVACSPQQRISRIVSRHPELKVKDSLRFSDSIIVPARYLSKRLPDSLLFLLHDNDSIVISSNGITVVLKHAKDTTCITITAKPDTLVMDTTLHVEKIKVVQDDTKDQKHAMWKRWQNIIILLLVVLALFGVIKVIKLFKI